ncbi:MAG: hypothetical protein J3K34DRAFT_401994, partial [Monoraphidium minutum]
MLPSVAMQRRCGPRGAWRAAGGCAIFQLQPDTVCGGVGAMKAWGRAEQGQRGGREKRRPHGRMGGPPRPRAARRRRNPTRPAGRRGAGGPARSFLQSTAGARARTHVRAWRGPGTKGGARATVGHACTQNMAGARGGGAGGGAKRHTTRAPGRNRGWGEGAGPRWALRARPRAPSSLQAVPRTRRGPPVLLNACLKPHGSVGAIKGARQLSAAPRRAAARRPCGAHFSPRGAAARSGGAVAALRKAREPQSRPR